VIDAAKKEAKGAYLFDNAEKDFFKICFEAAKKGLPLSSKVDCDTTTDDTRDYIRTELEVLNTTRALRAKFTIEDAKRTLLACGVAPQRAVFEQWAKLLLGVDK